MPHTQTMFNTLSRTHATVQRATALLPTVARCKDNCSSEKAKDALRQTTQPCNEIIIPKALQGLADHQGCDSYLTIIDAPEGRTLLICWQLLVAQLLQQVVVVVLVVVAQAARCSAPSAAMYMSLKIVECLADVAAATAEAPLAAALAAAALAAATWAVAAFG